MGQIQSIGFKTGIADAQEDLAFGCIPLEFWVDNVLFPPDICGELFSFPEPLFICGRAWFEYDKNDVPNRIVGQAGIKIIDDAYSSALPFRKNGKTNFQGAVSVFNKTYCEDGGITEDGVCIIEETSIRADQLPQVIVENTGKGLLLTEGICTSAQVLYADSIMMAFENITDAPRFTWGALGESGSIFGIF